MPTAPPPTAPVAVENFAGPGGWDVAAAALGLHVIGVELDPDALATRRAAGHGTHPGDVAALDPLEVADGGAVDGYIGSPPCPLYSNAGQRLGIVVLPILIAAVPMAADPATLTAVRQMAADAIADVLDPGDDAPLTLDLGGLDPEHVAEAHRLAREAALVLEPVRWVTALRPRWVALEQVPAVQPVWDAVAAHLADLGYHVATGTLDAADFGVPQHRRRAILVANLDRPVTLPPATHAKAATGDLARWVTMGEAIGIGFTDRPAPTVVGCSADGGPRPLDGGAGAREAVRQAQAAGAWVGFPRRDDGRPDGTDSDGYRLRDRFPIDDAAPTVTEKARSWRLVPGTYATRDDGNRRLYTLDEPAPTLAFGHDAAAWRWVLDPDPALAEALALNTGRDWKPGGTRADAQTIGTDQPAPTVTAVPSQWQWVLDRPATTVMGDPRIWPPGHKVNASDVARLGAEEAAARYGNRAGTGALPVTIEQAAALQTFPVGYPWRGSRSAQFRQVGDAVPPLLALHVLRAAGAGQ